MQSPRAAAKAKDGRRAEAGDGRKKDLKNPALSCKACSFMKAPGRRGDEDIDRGHPRQLIPKVPKHVLEKRAGNQVKVAEIRPSVTEVKDGPPADRKSQ